MKNGKNWTGKEQAATTALGRGKGNISHHLTFHRQHIQLLEVRTGGVSALVVPAVAALDAVKAVKAVDADARRHPRTF
ncbi:hypothetical protein V500_07793 [Pseudogymnoascus sp. VKM F-4518 (FW-2643)]|nr:hypothetical protein V500_07793 [Pseudogymnoascus sp. VKM F-4518 (FW-2643)]